MTEIIETTPTIEETVPPESEEVKKICPNVKTYCRKSDGVVVTYVYNQSQYSKKYYEKIKDTLKEYVDCEICNCRYQKWNKGHHNASKKHIKEVNKHRVFLPPTPPEMKDETEIEKEENKDKFVVYRGIKYP